MKKIISLFLLLFLLVGMVPSPGFCEDKKNDATVGAANAGTASGEQTLLGLNALTIGIGAAVVAAIAVIIIASGGSSSTTTNH